MVRALRHKILSNKWKLGKIIAAFGLEAAASAVASSLNVHRTHTHTHTARESEKKQRKGKIELKGF